MPSHDTPDRLWTPEEASDYLNIPVSTLAQHRHYGRGVPYVKVGRHVRYDPAEVKRYLRDQSVDTGQAA